MYGDGIVKRIGDFWVKSILTWLENYGINVDWGNFNMGGETWGVPKILKGLLRVL